MRSCVMACTVGYFIDDANTFARLFPVYLMGKVCKKIDRHAEGAYGLR